MYYRDLTMLIIIIFLQIIPVMVYNSLGWTRHDYVTVYVPTLGSDQSYKVEDVNSVDVKSQVINW